MGKKVKKHSSEFKFKVVLESYIKDSVAVHHEYHNHSSSPHRFGDTAPTCPDTCDL